MSTTHSNIEQPLPEEPRLKEGLVRWIPIVVPLLAVLIAGETYFIAWAILERV